MARSTPRSPDHRLRVFISSTLIELRAARAAARRAVEQFYLTAVMLDLGSRPHPPREQYAAYLGNSDLFIGIYWQSYGWVAFGAEISGVEDELRLSAGMPRLLYVQEPAPHRDERLAALLDELRAEASTSYKTYGDVDELEHLILDDLAVLLTERFEVHTPPPTTAPTPATHSVVIEPANPLLGRETELQLARSWLESERVRLVSLTGPGGVGKSRLALELAKLETEHFSDGVWTVLLEAVRNPAAVLTTIARVLGVRTGAGKDADDVLDALRTRLAGRHTLLVLDNFEHVLDAAVDLARLIEDCEGLHVLVTSRSALRIRAEHELPVAPLPVPDDPAHDPLERLSSNAAVQLFVARAAAVNVDIGADEATLRAVAEICRHLDGLPLAIELAAARARLLPPHQLLRRLQQRFAILTGGAADMPERHQTLRATIDWGYDLLEPDEQLALERLAVFAGGWTLAAAEAVFAASDAADIDVLDVLDGLVTKSFVTPPTGAGASPRFGMLETIREYATDRLRAAPAAEATIQAHAAYFLDYAEQAAQHFQGPDQGIWFEALEEDHDNLLAALRRLDERDDFERVLRITAALGRLWLVHSHLADATHWIGLCMDRSQGRRDRLRAELLTWAGWLALFVRGDPDAAEVISHEALELRREMGDRHGEAVEVLALGNVAVFRGDAEAARHWYAQTAAIAEAEDDEEMRGRAVSNLGVVARAAGDLDAARTALLEARRINESRGDEHSVVIADLNLAGVALDAGDPDEAERLTVASIRRSQSVGDEFSLLEGLEHLSAAWTQQGRLLAGGWLYGAAEAMARSLSLVRNRIEAPLYERYVTQARACAEERGQGAAFAAMWAAGSAAGRAAAVAVALGEQPPPDSD